MTDNKLIQYHDLVSAIICALEERDTYTEFHSIRVADMSQQICKLMNLSEEESEKIHIAAHLHDIGKIGIDDSVLRKEGKLNFEEWNKIKSHSFIGYKILHKIKSFGEISEIVLHHHERWDGKGYPSEIKEKEIPLGSRIIAVVDSIDAMMSKRCYRNNLTSEQCKAEIKKNIGLMYDPKIAALVLNKWDEIVSARNDFNAMEKNEIETLDCIWSGI